MPFHLRPRREAQALASWLVVNIAYLLWNVLQRISYITQPLISLQTISHQNSDVMFRLLSTERFRLSRASINHDEVPFEQQKTTLKNFPGAIFLEAARQASSYTIYYDTVLTIQALPQ
jgi:hypothetical protein